LLTLFKSLIVMNNDGHVSLRDLFIFLKCPRVNTTMCHVSTQQCVTCQSQCFIFNLVPILFLFNLVLNSF